jgi:hypothetical protein
MLPSRPALTRRGDSDWLIRDNGIKAGAFRGSNDHEIVLENGLISRTFRIVPNGATVAFDNLMTGSSILRAVKPEALVSLDGRSYDVGGLVGQPEQAYLLPEWVDTMRASTNSFRCTGFKFGKTSAPFGWGRKRHSMDLPWPAPGASLAFHYESDEPDLQRLEVIIHYELYDGVPVLGKWITITNNRTNSLRLNSFTGEILAPTEVESAVDERSFRSWRLPALDLLSDYSFHGMDVTTASQTTTWLADPTYTSQVNYELKMPALVVSRPPLGPDLELRPGESFNSFRTYVVVHDSDDRERQGLTLRRVQRVLAPWATENPIMMHVRSADSKIFRVAVDQCAAVGFEMIIYTFGSGLNMENTSEDYIARIKADVDYAHARGIQVGAYSLLASQACERRR